MEFLSVLFSVTLLAFFIFLAKNRAKIKGKIGEISVASRLNLLNHNDYKILNNVILQTKNGGTVQIDHIIVSVYGIFVIETKNYKGWISGFSEMRTRKTGCKSYTRKKISSEIP